MTSASIIARVYFINLTVVFFSVDPLSTWASRVKSQTLHGEPSQTSVGDVRRSPALVAQASRTTSLKEAPLVPSNSIVEPIGARLAPLADDHHAPTMQQAAPAASHKVLFEPTHPSTQRSSFLQTGAMMETVRGRLSSLSSSFADMAERAAIGAQQEAHLVATSARQQASSWTETISEKPAETVTIALAMLVTICIVSQAVTSNEEALLRTKVSDQRNALETSIEELISDMEIIVSKIIESSAYFAEQNFEGKRRAFVTNLRQASEAGALTSPSLKKPFRRFVEQWLNAFAECSLEPIGSPIQVVCKEELDECEDASQMARLLVDRLEPMRVNFLCKRDALMGQEGGLSLPALANAEGGGRAKMKALIQASAAASLLTRLAQRKKVWSSWSSWFAVGKGLGFSFGCATPDGERTAGCFPFVVACCCVRLSVLSLKHGLLLAVPWCCTGSFAWNCLHRSVHFAVIAFLAFTGSVVVLLRFSDHVGHVESQIEELHQTKIAAKTRHDEVEQLYGRLENVTSLWLHRTVPHLDILTEVHEESRDVSVERLVDFFETSNTMLEKVRLALGPLEIWCGAKMLHELQLVAVAGQLTDTIGSFTIKKNAPKSKGTRYLNRKETDLHAKLEGWDEMQTAKQCFSCSRNFSLVVRRHRCRGCGGVVCRSCSSQTRPVPKLGFLDAVRVCDVCVKRLDDEAIEDAEKLMTRAAMPDLLSKVTLLSFLSVTVDEMLSTSPEPLGDFSRTYLRLRVADSAWVRSDALQPNSPPVWKADFFFPVRKNDKVLMIELLRDSPAWNDELLGSADIRFRDLNINERHSLKIKLGDNPTVPKSSGGVRPRGVLALRLQLAADAWHLGDY